VQLRLCAGNYPKPIPANVTILPRLPLHAFRDEVARASVVVVPLTGSPPVSGITVIAMAKMMGKPVIASDNRVVRIQIRSQGEGGYLAQVGNPVLMRSLLTALMESPTERERLSREARAQAVRDLSMNAFIDRMLDGETRVLSGCASMPAGGGSSARG
jgi:glycosyltransferase involved in cell wall biosynthesis